MTIYYRKLKYLMSQECISQGDLCEILGKSWGYVNTRMNGKFAFTTEDVYSICDALHIPYSDICIFFPKGGIHIPEKRGVHA